MVISEIKKLKNPTQTSYQRLIIKCDECGREWDSNLLNQLIGYKKYNKDLCRGCKQHRQCILGIRKKQYINAGITAKKRQTGKTLEEILGKEKAHIAKQKNSKANSGKNNANFGGIHSHGFGNKEQKDKFKGKTFEEIYGIEKAIKLKKQRSFYSSGERNPMYGKPSPQGSGNGWSGWYKNWFFRSLKELTYMIYVIERFNLKWKNGEQKKYKIDYVDWKGNNRTYHPDFLLEEKYLVEIKPKKLWNSDTVKRKQEAAKKWCDENGLTYKLTICLKQLTFKEIKYLIEKGELVFINRYKEKFKNLNL